MLVSLGITANQVTIAAFLFSSLFGFLIAVFPAAAWPLQAMPAVLIVRLALNAIDGIMAREHGMKTALGAILNELGDVLSDVALYLPLALVAGIDSGVIVVVVLLAVVSEMTGVLALQIGAARRYDGPMGKSDRAVLFGLLCLLLGLDVIAARWFNYAMIATAVLLIITIINRARGALAKAA